MYIHINVWTPQRLNPEQKAFFEKHLRPWAERFFVDLETTKDAQFYKAVGQVGRLFIAIETEAFALPQ